MNPSSTFLAATFLSAAMLFSGAAHGGLAHPFLNPNCDGITVSAPCERVDLVRSNEPRLGGKEPSDEDYRL